jgi:hypothetical protein
MKGFTLENVMAGVDFTACFRDETLEVVSKSQIRFKGKASGRSGKRSIQGYVSICRRSATQPLSLRWGFETTSRNFVTINQHAPVLQKILKFHMLVKSKVFIPINRKGFRCHDVPNRFKTNTGRNTRVY